jgi:L-asparaginase
MAVEEKIPLPGPYQPTLIIHGGAGNIARKNLPLDLYEEYESSLLEYLDSTRQWLFVGASALDAAVHAVSLMEDDPLFNCGKGSVFTEKGTIEMEASVMVASVDPDRGGRDEGSRAAEVKRGAGVMLVKNTRHPIQLARELLMEKLDGRARSMHCQLSGPEVEEWGWREKGLERKNDDWFWTKRRWAEHLRGLKNDSVLEQSGEVDIDDEDGFLPSQGTVGAVCMDSWGDIAVATSTGGLTNKKVGRIGDTPTLGAGFWAESWDEPVRRCELPSKAGPVTAHNPRKTVTFGSRLATAIQAGFGDLLLNCFPTTAVSGEQSMPLVFGGDKSARNGYFSSTSILKQQSPMNPPRMNLEGFRVSQKQGSQTRRRAVALSGTGNGDTFLRTAACRTVAAICRFSADSPDQEPVFLAKAMRRIAGPDGEMQKSAGDRWRVTGEGQAGIIGIEVCDLESDTADDINVQAASRPRRRKGRVVSDFNCGGLWRAWMDEKTGKGKVMVFKEEYR